MPAASSWIAGPNTARVIYYHNEEQKRLAEESKEDLARSGPFKKPVVTEIVKFTNFYPAEDYHQDYAHKNPVRYKYYRWNSGRDQFLQRSGADNCMPPNLPATPNIPNPAMRNCGKS